MATKIFHAEEPLIHRNRRKMISATRSMSRMSTSDIRRNPNNARNILYLSNSWFFGTGPNVNPANIAKS